MALDTPLHELVAAQARRTPHACAVVSGSTRLSYAELDRRANRLAHLLPAGEVVGVYLDRDADLVVALLAVLKAGSGYTLLDPDFPVGRLCSVLTDSSAAAMVTTTALAKRLDAPAAVCLDAVDLTRGPDTAPQRPAGPIACVMFTSGSSGRPKGVAASHRVLAATYLDQEYARFDADQVWLQCSPVSWDGFALEVFGALLFGGTCVLHPGQRPDPETIRDLVRAHRVTQLQLSASLFNFLVDEFPDTFAGLAVVFTGGERASVPHVAALARRYPHLRIVNGYGPVESMGFTTWHTVRADDLTATSVPIGVPVRHKDVLVLDDAMRPVPAGVTGELYLAGDGLAHGYAGMPGATARRFVPDPFGPPGTRLYRTGDLGYRTTDGLLEIVGRVDGQLKIRGYRVEPGEIEHALVTYPSVREAAVTLHRSATGAERLVAYLTVHGAAPTYRQLRDHLRELLPGYMIPASVTVLDALPLTPSGKTDRAALPEPAVDGTAPPGSGIDGVTPPADELTAAIGAIWALVLGVDVVRPTDDFFALGGHSLTAVRVLYLVRHRLGVEVALRDLLDANSLAEFAARVAAPPATAAPKRPALVARRGPR